MPILSRIAFTITGKLTNLTADKDIVKGVPVKENETFEFTLKPATDYRLPEDITVTPSTIKYTYDSKTGKVVIEKVTENITITATAIDDHHFNVILKPGEGVVATPNASSSHLRLARRPRSTWCSPPPRDIPTMALIAVKMGDKTLYRRYGLYPMRSKTGAFALLKGIDATLTISTPKGVKKQYTVKVTATSLYPDGCARKRCPWRSVIVQSGAGRGLDLPEAIVVKMGGKALAAATDYTYNKATGEVSIAKVTENVEVTAVAVAKTYEVKLNLTNLTSDFVSGTKVTHGKSLDIQLTAPADYKLPQAVTVLMNGKPAEHTYQNGKISITKVLGPIEITAKANKLYPVTENAEGVTIEGTENVEEGETFTAELEPNTGYHSAIRDQCRYEWSPVECRGVFL